MKHVKLRPEYVKIMGRIYRVEFLEKTPMGQMNVGQCDNHDMIIDILEHQHPIEEADTLIHEILHAIWFTMSISMGGADEEAVVRRMATGLMGVILDNPHLLKYLAAIKNPDL